jgi:hypothetical protein
VGRGGLGADRRAAQDQLALGVAQQVGEVRGAPGELAHPRWAGEVAGLLVLAQPGIDRGDVEAVLVSNPIAVLARASLDAYEDHFPLP